MYTEKLQKSTWQGNYKKHIHREITKKWTGLNNSFYKQQDHYIIFCNSVNYKIKIVSG